MARFSFAIIAAALFFGATINATPVTARRGLATRAEGAELSETQCTDSAIVGSLLTTSLSLLEKSAKSADAAANAELETLKAFLTAANLIENQVLAGCDGNNTNTNNTEGDNNNKEGSEAGKVTAEPATSSSAATKTTQTKAKADAAVKNAKVLIINVLVSDVSTMLNQFLPYFPAFQPSVAAIIASAKAAMKTQRPSRFGGRPGPRPRRRLL
ncbi:hypothetical protein R3P38DRAFT_617676 [Favolaschia claudopus]|uniref:Uncharacterized protein n=1 Tax=Favolaschia claudopus TaxID=2862362 RepID=A0AAW0CB31_9AGAR